MSELKGTPVSSQPKVRVFALSPRDPEPLDCITAYLLFFFSLLKPVGPMNAGGDKNALNRPVGPDDKRDWSFRLLDCFPRCRLCKKDQLNLLTISHG